MVAIRLKQLGYAIVAFLLVSCSSPLTSSWQNGASLTAEQYQQRAARAKDAATRANNLAWATEQFIWQRRFHQAKHLLGELPQQSAYLGEILRAQLALVDGRPKLARYHLERSAASPAMRVAWPDYWQTRYHQWRVCSEQQAYNLGGELVRRTQLLHWIAQRSFTLEHELLALWQALPERPAALATVADNSDVQAWFALKKLVRSWPLNEQQWLSQLVNWRQQYPGHLANRLFSMSTQQMAAQSVTQVRRIALLLPLHGRYAAVGKAVHNGLLAAYYQSRKQSNAQVTMRVFDTAVTDVQQAYQQAVKWGAHFVIGPLQPGHVRAIASLAQRPVPVLALNRSLDYGRKQGLYHFGLFPEDEARQLAERMVRQHKRLVIAIAPQGDWGKRVVQAFSDTLRRNGGLLVDTLYFDRDQRSLVDQIKQLLHIDQGEQRLAQLQALSGQEMKFIARRRRDIDAVFLAASVGQQQRIVPLLRFFYVNRTPIYLVSQTGGLAAYRSRDLHQVLLGGMPWLAEQPDEADVPLTAIRKQVTQTWQHMNAYHTAFYAMGVDAYYLVWYWPRLQLLPQVGIAGATGQLYLEDQQIHRRLLWSKIDQQRLVTIGPSCLESFTQ